MHSSWFRFSMFGSTAVTTVEVVVPTFTKNDRCDRCGAAAQMRVWLEKSELQFCAHHARKHHAKLAESVHPDLIEVAD